MRFLPSKTAAETALSNVHNLTDTWQGRFAFPRRYEPVSFTAELTHVGDRLWGAITEKGMLGTSAGAALTSTVIGHVSADAVTFLKTYDALVAGYDAVHYSGSVGDGGLEISGIWTIPGSWSGTFIMIRTSGLPVLKHVNVQEQV